MKQSCSSLILLLACSCPELLIIFLNFRNKISGDRAPGTQDSINNNIPLESSEDTQGYHHLVVGPLWDGTTSRQIPSQEVQSAGEVFQSVRVPEHDESPPGAGLRGGDRGDVQRR